MQVISTRRFSPAQLLLPFYLLIITLPAMAATRYVKAGGSGSGTSWSDASGDLQAMIDASASGDEVWVTTGSYQPASGQSFAMRAGVKIYGGFLGTETAITQRIAGNRSDLVGNGAPVISNPAGLTASALLDGCTISGGTNFGVSNTTTSPAFNDCYFTSNSGPSGGGMYNYDHASPTVTNCVFTNNTTSGTGGGMHNETYSSPTVTNCVFKNNTSSGGGGMSNLSYSKPILLNCTFENNSSTNYAGGMYTATYSSPTLTNCTFKGNAAPSYYGGGMYTTGQGSISLTDCLFDGNTGALGGAVGNSSATAIRLSRCTFINNTAYEGGAVYNSQNTPVTMISCTFKANKANFGNGAALCNETSGACTITNCLFSGNYASGYGGAIYNFSTATSYLTNCTMAGNYASAGTVYSTTVSALYYRNCIVYNNNSGITTTSSTNIFNSLIQNLTSTANNNISGTTNPLFVNPVAPGQSNDGDYRLQPCSPLVNMGSNTYYASGQTPNLSAITTDLDANPRFYRTTIDLGAYEQQGIATVTTSGAGIVHVKAGANGSGQSWDCAMGDLQAAINASTAGGQVWVATGTYIPNRRADATGTITIGDRSNTFLLKKDVKIYGGFAGTETTITSRIAGSNTTVLSGDLNSDDNGFTNNSENAYNVVTITGDAGTAVLDGFTRQGGNCYTTSGGAGISCSNSSPVLNNLIIQGNAGRYGGGLNLNSSTATVTNTIIRGNMGFYGGGVMGSNCGASFTNVLISGNNAIEQGGAMYHEWAAAPVLTNVTIAGNNGGTAGAIYNNLGPSLQVRNSIIYGNSSGIVNQNGTPTFQYSLVQGETSTGNGNIYGTANPLFVNLLSPGVNTGGDYQLQVCSPAINTGSNTLYNSGQTPDLSTIITNLSATARIQGTAIDMGAYEYTGNPIATDMLALQGDIAITAINNTTVLKALGNNCRAIATVQPTGSSTALSGNINGYVWIETTQPANYVKRHYQLTPATNASTATARVTLYFTQAEFDAFNAVNTVKLPASANDANGIANLLVEKFAGSSSDGSGLPLSYPGNSITINPNDADIIWNSALARWEVSVNVTGFSGFFVKAQFTTLPLTLLSFTGSQYNGYNLLKWTTTDEVNTQQFIVERSADGSTFNAVATLAANGSGNGNYSYKDYITFSGKLYYRLKMVDNNGSFTYSPLVTLINNGSSALSIYPNPASNSISINAGAALANSQVGLYSINGKLLQTITVTGNVQTINIQTLAAGVYTLQFANGAAVKFIKH